MGPRFWPYDRYPKQSQRHQLDPQFGAARGQVWLSYGQDAYLYWAWGSGLRAGDVISLDWADGNQTNRYHACHRIVAKGASSTTTYAVKTVPGRWVRACVKAGSTRRCTTPWRKAS